jgi:glutamate formiminotransferase/formiminotetrahydrofolate cyclodeaminase
MVSTHETGESRHMSEKRIVECVPNFSEGRDRSILDAISRSISSVTGVSLLDVDPGADTNRTVYTFVGGPEVVSEAAFRAAKTARELIDMSKHSGAHPRMGALDVCPFVPVSGVTMEDCVLLSKAFGERLGRELGVPVYLYENAATRSGRRSLADIRAGEYEALPARLAMAEWAPDYGPSIFVPGWGATATGAREFLIAYNVNLNCRDRKLANEVALAIREGGRTAKDKDGNTVRDKSGNPVKVPGRLRNVRAIGWYIDAYKRAQVSINLVDYRTTPLHVVFETAKEEAEKIGLVVTGSEVVGLLPLEPLLRAGRHFLRKMGKSEGASERELVATAVRSMGLDSVSSFDPEKKIVEYAIRNPAPLASLKVDEFVDEVASESPAPGGGSVAALAGSLGAALATMVANLTVGKKGYESVWRDMSELSVKGQQIKGALVRAIDEDTAAFNELMDAMKLPKATEADRMTREAAMQDGYRRASLVPLETARACLEAIRLCIAAAEGGNVNSASDAGVGALLARAGVEGAALNVITNLGSISDQVFASGMRSKACAMIEEAESLKNQALALVAKSMKV